MPVLIGVEQLISDDNVADIKKNIFGLSDLNQKIYRIFSMKYALALFKGKRNVLVRPCMWEDPFENFFLNAVGQDSLGKVISLENIRNSWYGQCWTTTPESDAMWRIYSHKKSGVRLGTTVEKLFNSFCVFGDRYAALKFFIGRVEYVKQNAIAKFAENMNFSDVATGADNQNFAKLLLIKRMAFKHEQEVRLLYCDSENQHINEKTVDFYFDTNSIIDSVMFDPRLEDNKFLSYSKKFKKTGFKKHISKSKLYEAPRLIVNI